MIFLVEKTQNPREGINVHEADPFGTLKIKKNLEPEEMLLVIFDYAAKIANERRLDHLIMLMADMGREMVVSDRCTVWLIDKQNNELYSTVAHGVPQLRLPRDAGLVGHSITTGQPIFIEDAYVNTEFKDVLESGAIAMDLKTGYRTKALMVIPFRNNEGEIMGAYQAVNKLTAEEQFSKKDLEHLTLAASYAGKSLNPPCSPMKLKKPKKKSSSQWERSARAVPRKLAIMSNV